ncbi:MAG: class II aldolase/adducin family protein [Actinomycetota bacterium]|nr:class II aldolase/adducin family protein [Actinomycetota bacterium]
MTAEADALVAAVERLFAAGVMSHSGHGNLSTRLPEERMLLTATGVLGGISTGDFATVGLDGTEYDGNLQPGSREIMGMHAVVYRERPEVGAVIHTHSPAVTAFAVAGRALPCRYEGLLRFGQATDVPVVPWAPRGSPESVAGIASALQTAPDTSAVLLGNHGLLAFGPGPAAAADLVITLEEGAEAEWRAATLGGSSPLPPDALEAVLRSISAAATRRQP